MEWQVARDPRLWAVVTEPDSILFAQRPTRAEAEAVAEKEEGLIRKFGTPRVVPPVVSDLGARRRYRAAMGELERRGFELGDL